MNRSCVLGLPSVEFLWNISERRCVHPRHKPDSQDAASVCPSEKPRGPEAGRHAAALRYTPPDAPKVVANGTDAVADAIIERAIQSGVRIYEQPDLARLLTALEVDAQIPGELYVAVAEVLALVYHLEGKDPREEHGGRTDKARLEGPTDGKPPVGPVGKDA